MLLEAVRDVCLRLGLQRRYWIAYSGGVDSHVLLYLCAQLRKELACEFNVIHINHGLSPNAAKWSQHCAAISGALDLPFISESINLNLAQGDSLEEKARMLRYETIAKHISSDDVLLTAHHQQDQTETFLIQMLRGAGLKGLSAMPEIKPFHAGLHVRPLLAFDRAALVSFAESQQLQWIEDDSNENRLFARNYLRHQVLPVMAARWPAAVATIARSAQHCAEAEQLLTEMAAESLLQASGSKPNTLSISRLLLLSEAKQRWLLRLWIHQHGFRLPSQKKLATIFKTMLHTAWDKMPIVTWTGCVLRRYRDDLYLSAPRTELNTNDIYQWQLSSPLTLNGVGVLSATPAIGQGLRVSELTVKFRQGGEKIKLTGRPRRTLKNLLNEWGVLPWERHLLPLIYHGDELIGVVGYYYHEDWLAGENQAGWVVELATHSP